MTRVHKRCTLPAVVLIGLVSNELSVPVSRLSSLKSQSSEPKDTNVRTHMRYVRTHI
jgi:hypothetical protein